MSSIAYEEQARAIPTDQAAGLYRKQRYLFPIGNGLIVLWRKER